MYKHLHDVKRFPEEAVKFYIAQLALALSHLHENKLVHRDLKLENVLMDSDGYIKLCDFGLAKLLNRDDDITYTFGGTPEYLAPEIVSQTGHSYEVDWWTLGILTYELCGGRTPFYHRNPHMISKLIKRGKHIFPDEKKHKISMSEEMKDFISCLLEKEPKLRLGHKSKNDILGHPWLVTVDWENLIQKKLKAPMLPGSK